MKASQVKFSASALKKEITRRLVEEQTQRLIEYAKTTIRQIGKAIQLRGGANNMDRTGNLLNSLCWGVAYRGKLKASGYYREANSLRESYLHEWNSVDRTLYPVYGHMYAEDYIANWGAGSGGGVYAQGWRVFFAILAPYWGYWEEGFTFRGKHGTKKMRFWVMTRFYDKVTKDLKPNAHKLDIYVPTYSRKSLETRNENFIGVERHKRQWRERHKKRNKL